jgi:hypothetical protein
MSIDLLKLVSHFRPFEDRENTNAWFRTLVPWVGPEAFLNIVYKPASPSLLSDVARKCRFPAAVVEFFTHQNGAMLFSGSLNLYGIVEPGRLLNREDRFTLPPFNIERENESRSFDRDRFLVLGGYKFGGSRVCVDRSDEHVHVFSKRQQTPIASWPDFDRWLTSEITRLCGLFDNDGRRTAPESDTGPPESTNCIER